MPARYLRSLARVAAPIICALPLAAQSTVLVSANPGTGEQLDGNGGLPSVSDDGRVVFESSAYSFGAVQPGFGPYYSNIFFSDCDAPSPTALTGTFGANNGPSFSADISSNGRWAAFVSSNGALPGSNGKAHVYVRDIDHHQTVNLTTLGNGDCSKPSISSHGGYVAFSSAASNLVANDTNGLTDVFLRDRGAAVTTRVSVGPANAQANGSSIDAQVSELGTFVVFTSGASNLVAGDTNGVWDIFLRDIAAGATVRVSVASGGGQSNGDSFGPSISGDGQLVAFASNASNLDASDSNGAADIFLRGWSVDSTTRLSIAPGGGPANGASSYPSMSADGRFVAFESVASNLVANDSNGCSDVFVFDRATGQTTRVSVGSSGTQGSGQSHSASISADGAHVVFASAASNLDAGDTNGFADIFCHEWIHVCFVDGDGDGFGAGAPVLSQPHVACGSGFVANSLDCDDANAAAHPGAPELCDGIDNDCDGDIDENPPSISSYCTPGTTVHGCVPAISGTGAPSSVASSGFTIAVSAVDGQRYGTIFFGFSQTAQNWAVGSSSYLCMFFPVQRTGVLDSGGTIGACDGVLSVDWNAWRATNPGALGAPFAAGQVLYAQGWFRDPGAAKQTNLSDGLKFTLCN